MELFMRNLPFSLSQTDVIRELAQIIHAEPYQSMFPLPISFEVHLHRGRRGSRTSTHNGCGTLTLPTEQIANRLLAEYGGNNPRRQLGMGGRHVMITRSRRQADPTLVARIGATPYRDPSEIEQSERTRQEIEHSRATIASIQFGWDCRDSSFSAEWEYTPVNSDLIFDKERRQFRVGVACTSEGDLSFVIRFSQVSYAAVSTQDHREPCLQLSLTAAPSFELEKSQPLQAHASLEQIIAQVVHAMQEQKPLPRRRFPFLPVQNSAGIPHSATSQFSSHALRLVFRGAEALRSYCHAARLCGAQYIRADHPVHRHNLFSCERQVELSESLMTLPYKVAFQIEAFLHNLLADLKEILVLVPYVRSMIQNHGVNYALAFLQHLSIQCEHFYPEGEVTWSEFVRSCTQAFQETYREDTYASSQILEDPNLFFCHHVNVTPTRIELQGPFPERSNRVLRWFPDHHHHFLRVSFVEEGGGKYRFEPNEIDGSHFIKLRVGGAMSSGLKVGRRQFEFLAWSQSALKEHTVYFVHSFIHEGQLINAKSIIRRLGNFQDLAFDRQLARCPARYAARISQALSATDASVLVEAENITITQDIEANSRCFTDGCGSISPDIATSIARAREGARYRGVTHTPPAIQVRFQGAKGMLCIDYRLAGSVVVLRPSMIKFEAPDSNIIEICRVFDTPGKYYLNRPLVMLQEGLNVPYDTFRHYQDQAVNEAWGALQSLEGSAKLLDMHGLGASFRLPSVFNSLRLSGQNTLENPFIKTALRFAVHHVLREIKHKARIPIPPPAVTLVGVPDIHEYLQPGEIFACVRWPGRQDYFMEDDVLISRSPTIHPGDVRVVRAIGRPPTGSPFSTEPLRNCVVFSVKGDRPLPSCLGGGDLDGDEYNLIPLNIFPQFRPGRPNVTPAEYAPAPKRILDHLATTEDVVDFFLEYINSDVLGIVATNWLMIADSSPQHIFDEKCLKLAQLHSDAVDYPKSGTPVALNDVPKPGKVRPDWSAPETASNEPSKYYPSSRAIGKLYREIELPPLRIQRRTANRGQRRAAHHDHDSDDDEVLVEAARGLAINGDQNFHQELESTVEEVMSPYMYSSYDSTAIDDIPFVFQRYVGELHRICSTFSLNGLRGAMLTEEEVIIGTIVAKTAQTRVRRDTMAKMREQSAILVRHVLSDLSGGNEVHPLAHLRRAKAAWESCLEEGNEFGARSFGLVALVAIFEAINKIETRY